VTGDMKVQKSVHDVPRSTWDIILRNAANLLGIKLPPRGTKKTGVPKRKCGSTTASKQSKDDSQSTSVVQLGNLLSNCQILCFVQLNIFQLLPLMVSTVW